MGQQNLTFTFTGPWLVGLAYGLVIPQSGVLDHTQGIGLV
jgi:hypothetical protein